MNLRQEIKTIIDTYHPRNTWSGEFNIQLFHETFRHETVADATHRSYDRLEFLGDSVLHLVISEYLYHRYLDQQEGFLTKLKINLEKSKSLAHLAQTIGITQFIKGRFPTRTIPEDVKEDVFESFIAFIYLSSGSFNLAERFFCALLEEMKDLAKILYYDDNYKDLLLRVFHQKEWGHPVYHNSTRRPGICRGVNDNKGREIGTGTGKTKQDAEQNASRAALIALGIIKDGRIDHDWIDKIEKKEESEEEDDTDKAQVPIHNKNSKKFTPRALAMFAKDYGVKLEQTIADPKLLLEAFTHKSYLIRTPEIKDPKNRVPLQEKSYDRLRFLGGAVIHFIMAEYLFHKFPDADEGMLTNLRSKLKNKNTLFILFKRCQLDPYALISTKIEMNHERNNKNIMGSCFIAMIGAVYLTYGIHKTRELMIAIVKKWVNHQALVDEEINYKEQLMMYYRQKGSIQPEYHLIKSTGPDHAKKYTMGVFFKGKEISNATASSKKKAEMRAAMKAYKLLRL
jgi:dsRNA-specific ribonuclease